MNKCTKHKLKHIHGKCWRCELCDLRFVSYEKGHAPFEENIELRQEIKKLKSCMRMLGKDFGVVYKK